MTIQRVITCDFCEHAQELPDMGLDGWGRIEGLKVHDDVTGLDLENPTACPVCFRNIIDFCIRLKNTGAT